MWCFVKILVVQSIYVLLKIFQDVTLHSCPTLSVLMHLALFPMMSNLFPFVETVGNGTALTDAAANAQLTPIAGNECRMHESVYSKLETGTHLPEEFERFQTDEEDVLIIKTYDIQSEFTDLFTKLRLFLKNKGVDVKCFVSFLKTVKGYATQSLFYAVFPELDKASDLIDVFEDVGGYCSWFNHSVICRIIKVYCEDSKKMKVAYQDFCRNLERYCRNRCKKCPLKNGYGHERESDKARMVVKVDRKWMDIRLDQLEEILFNIARILGIPRRTLYLYTVDKGCVQLTLLTPCYIPDALFPLTAEKEGAMTKMGVTFLHCENYLFLPSEMHIKLFHIHMKNEWMLSAALNLWVGYFFHPLRSIGIPNAKVCKYILLCSKFSLWQAVVKPIEENRPNSKSSFRPRYDFALCSCLHK